MAGRDERLLLGPGPSFALSLAFPRPIAMVMFFRVDERHGRSGRRERASSATIVRLHPSNQIVGGAGVERSILTAEDINVSDVFEWNLARAWLMREMAK